MSRSGRNPKSPAFQVYPSDFIHNVATAGMTAEEIGAYWLLLCYSWDGPLPNDHARLARMARMTPKRFAKAWVAVGPCFDVSEKGLTNPRMEREREFQKSNRDRLLKLSADGLAARQNGAKAQQSCAQSCDAPEAQRPKPNARIPTPSEEYPPTPRKRGAREQFIPAWPAPLDTPAVRAAWAEWERYRAEKRHRPYTPTGFARMVKPYANPAALVRDIEHSIASNWQGIHPAKGADLPKTTTADTFGAFQ